MEQEIFAVSSPGPSFKLTIYSCGALDFTVSATDGNYYRGERSSWSVQESEHQNFRNPSIRIPKNDKAQQI